MHHRVAEGDFITVTQLLLGHSHSIHFGSVGRAKICHRKSVPRGAHLGVIPADIRVAKNNGAVVLSAYRNYIFTQRNAVARGQQQRPGRKATLTLGEASLDSKHPASGGVFLFNHNLDWANKSISLVTRMLASRICKFTAQRAEQVGQLLKVRVSQSKPKPVRHNGSPANPHGSAAVHLTDKLAAKLNRAYPGAEQARESSLNCSLESALEALDTHCTRVARPERLVGTP